MMFRGSLVGTFFLVAACFAYAPWATLAICLVILVFCAGSFWGAGKSLALSQNKGFRRPSPDDIALHTRTNFRSML